MWIKVTETETLPRLDLLCDECGALFNAMPNDNRRAYWRMANIAGWARIARSPDRHVCANC
jgi:hypothetical protein